MIYAPEQGHPYSNCRQCIFGEVLTGNITARCLYKGDNVWVDQDEVCPVFVNRRELLAKNKEAILRFNKISKKDPDKNLFNFLEK